MHHMWPSRAGPFLPGNAPADDRIRKGEANHSDSAKLGQLSAITRSNVPVLSSGRQ
jgi:hypothetical protein